MSLKTIVTFIIILIYFNTSVDCLNLKKVVVISRHNIRTPLDISLESFTPKKWPKWSGPPGELTRKGALIEGYMGEYFSTWLQNKRLFSNEEEGHSNCPDEKSVNIFSNSVQRAIATANAFIRTAFPGCNITVHYNHTSYPEFDGVFRFLIKNDTDVYRVEGEREIREKLAISSLQGLYLILNNITDVKNAEVCRNLGSMCDFVEDKDDILFEAGSPPEIRGRFGIAKSMADAFVMSFYEGHPLEDVAWGQIRTDNQWKMVTKILDVEQDVRFNLTYVNEAANPLIKLIKQKLDDETKFSFLSGHDATFRAILHCLGFKPFELPDQYEPSPIGGKLVFQKWTDGAKDFLKVEYIYPSWTQIRDAVRLSPENPPKNVSMTLKTCAADVNGLCPWSDFEKLLNDLVT